MQPLTSVIIATRDRPGKLEETLRGLERQGLPAEAFEIVVVDDGSSPPLVLPARHGSRLLEARLTGGGRSKARNHGASMASGRVLVFLDDDIGVGPSFLESHLKGHERWPRALLTGAIRLPDSALRTPFGRFRQRLEQAGVPAAAGVGTPPNLAAAGNMSIERADFAAQGGFDADLRSGEDQDLALRHSAAGGSTGYLPEAIGIHRDEALDIGSYCRRVEWGYEHIVAFCMKHPEWPENRDRMAVNGPLRWASDGPGLALRKLAKQAIAAEPVTRFGFLLLRALERSAPGSRALERGYALLLGAFLLRGFRRGLRRYGATPLPRRSA